MEKGIKTMRDGMKGMTGDGRCMSSEAEETFQLSIEELKIDLGRNGELRNFADDRQQGIADEQLGHYKAESSCKMHWKRQPTDVYLGYTVADARIH